MTKIILELNKSVHDNANTYFSKAKKLKKKINGVEVTIDKTKELIKEFNNKKEKYIQRKKHQEKTNKIKKNNWYDKFRHTYTTSGNLVVFGKDSGTNEILIKKHLEENDIVIHTMAPGSPFGLIKGATKEGKLQISKQEIEEIAQIICCFSSQWKKGFGTADAFWVFPNQVSKTANTGEFISKGSFMIRGEKNILKNLQLRICLGVYEETHEIDGEEIKIIQTISGSENLLKQKCKNRFIKLEPGDFKYKALNKEIQKKLKTQIDELPKYIPNGCKILKK